MKRKLCQRNKTWLSEQLRRSRKEDLPFSFFVYFPSIRSAGCNGERLKRRGRLHPDWQRALFHPGWGEVPIVGPGGTVYWLEGFNKEQLPAELNPLWQDE